MNSKLNLLLATLLVLTLNPASGTNQPVIPTTCGCKGCCGGLQPPLNNSIEWGIQVGLARYSKPTTLASFSQVAFEKNGNLPDFSQIFGRFFSGGPLQQQQINLEIFQPQISAATFHPSCLFLQSDALFETLKKPAAGGFPEFIHQILTDDAFTLIDLLPAPASGWRLRTWKRDAAPLAKSGGFYVTTGFVGTTPLADVVFKRPDGTTGNNSLIYIQKETTGLSGTRTVTNEIVQTLDAGGKPATVTSKLFAGEGTAGALLSQENLAYSERGTKVWDYTITRETWTATAPGTSGDLTLTAKTLEDYDDFSTTAIGGELGMKRLVSTTEAYNVPGQSPRTTTFAYINSPENPSIHGRLQSATRPDGSWTYSEYAISPDSPVAITTEYSAWKDLAMAQRANARKTVTTVSASEALTETTLAGQLVAKSRTTLGVDSGFPFTTAETWDGSAWHVTTTAYHPDNAPAPSTGRIKWIENSDGTASTYSYATVGGQLVTTIRSGAGDRDGITAGTEVKTTHGIGNIAIAETTKDIASNVILAGWETDLTYNGGFDASGRPLKRIHNGDPGDHDIAHYACCGLEFSRARDGTVTQYVRDPLKRIVSETTTTGARVTTRTYDYTPSTDPQTLGLPATKVTTTATGVTGTVVQTTVSDFLGRTISSTSPGPMGTPETTIFAYSADGLVTTQTNPDGGTVITESYPDGRTKSVTGTGTIGQSYAYGTHIENGGGEVTTVTTANGVGGQSSSYTDLAGRTYKQTRTAPHGQTAVTTTVFNALGQGETITSSGQPTVKYLYNAEGEQIATWTDRNDDGQFNDTAVAGVKDSCTTTQSDYIAAASAPSPLGDSQRTITTVRTETDEDKVVSTSWQSVDGLRSRQVALGVANPSTATRTKPLDGASTSTQVNPDGTSTATTTTILANGNAQSTSTSYTSGASPSVIETNVTIADAMGRTIQTTNGRGHVTEYTYHADGGQTATITQVNAAPGGGNLVTESSYTLTPGSGRRINTKLPDGTFQYQETNLLGQTTRQWGSQTNPVKFTYDAAGRRATLTTYRADVENVESFPEGPTMPGDKTEWKYDDAGVLLEKIHADGNKTTYTYDIAGRLATRTWARGVVTVYSYTAGQLTGVEYFGSVPGWENYRNLRATWQAMVADPANHTAQEISDAEVAMLAAKAAAIHAATPAVTTTYDRLGRPISLSNGFSTTDYSYDLSTLAMDAESVTIDPDGSGPLPALTRTLDRSTDTLGRQSGTAVSAVGSGTPEHFTNYAYDNSGRLSTVTSPAGTFSYAYTPNSSLIATVTGPVHTVTNTWEPNRDVLDVKDNRIPSTSTPISRFDYTVNGINQRTQVQTTGSAFPSQPANWNWGYDALGHVVSADSPTNTFDRAYEYDQIGNRKKSADSALVTTGSSATVYDANSLNQYSQISVPSVQSVVPIHDQDGNATAYPLPVAPANNATLGYDGENRPISATTGTTTVSYVYDSQSRRVARNEGSNVTLYLYDAWNCLAEYTLHNSSFNLHTSHAWGLDLSGSLQGAGGVGGLLATTKFPLPVGEGQGEGVVYYATYDGNGNISEYLDTTGNWVAHYEYDPFGRTTVVNGTIAADFAYRFSTKPIDSATGLHYYGYRFYDSSMGRWLARDLLGEQGGINLYCFVRNSAVNAVDLLGAFTVSFHAFIHKDIGHEIRYYENAEDPVSSGFFFDEPGSALWYTATDHRGFGGGSSRIQSVSTEISISDIGNMEGKVWFESTVGESERIRKQWVLGNGASPFLVFREVKSATDFKAAEVAEDTGVDTSEVTVEASGSYPFSSLAPKIDYKIVFSFCRIDEKRAVVSVRGTHNKFPYYEALVDGSDHIWKYDAKAEGQDGPGLYNLNSSYNFEGWEMGVAE